jgi:hypothetical protein
MLNLTNKPFMLSVIMMNVVMLNAVAPCKLCVLLNVGLIHPIIVFDGKASSLPQGLVANREGRQSLCRIAALSVKRIIFGGESFSPFLE